MSSMLLTELMPEYTTLEFPLGALYEADGGLGVVAEGTDGPIANVFTAAFRPTFGDFDGDGDIDIDDFACFAGCMTGPGVPPAPGCEEKDADGDGDVDMMDFARLQIDFTGP